jgi:predicted amidohydrolase
MNMHAPRLSRCLAAVAVPAAFGVFASPADALVPLKVAICQIDAVDDDVEGNFANIEAAAAEAAAQGADLACFPECCILGWVNPNAFTLAHPIPGAWSDRLCDIASTHEIMMCVGLAERVNDRVYDAAILIDSDGTILLKHRKLNILYGLMTPDYTPGAVEDVTIVSTPFGTFGILICADTFIEPLVRGIGQAGIDYLLVPYGFGSTSSDDGPPPPGGSSLEQTIIQAAKWAHCPVIGTNRGSGEIAYGPWAGGGYDGYSAVADGDGTLLCTLAGARSDLRIYTFNAARGDFDADTDADLRDYGRFLDCYNGSGRPPAMACRFDADFDNDGDVDFTDYWDFLSCFNGPNRPAACP